MSKPPLKGEAKPPVFKPMGIEVKLRPMFGCKIDLPGEGTDEWGTGIECDPDWEPMPPPKPEWPLPHFPIVHHGYCGLIPLEYPNSLSADCERHRCALDACNNATAECWPIISGQYSAKSRALPLFSYSQWKDGKLVNADCSIIRAIANQIDTCHAGDEVYIAIAAWWSEGWPIAQAVMNAKARGVAVQIITHPVREYWAHTADWISSLLKDAVGSSNIAYWNNPAPFTNISHNKFVLIRNWQKQHLVLIGGANWASFDVARNCDLLTVNSQTIWWAFKAYWDSLWSAAKFGKPKVYQSKAEDPETGVTAQFWPRVTEEEMMVKVEEGGQDPEKNPYHQIISQYQFGPNTKIRIIMSKWVGKCYYENPWDGGPGSDLLSLLRTYRTGGSDVRVIGNHHDDFDCHDHNETSGGVWACLDENNIPWAKCAPHSKVLLISGPLKGTGVMHQAVYTGSMNISYEPTMPDVIIGVHNDPVIFAQYEDWWKWLCANTAMSRGGGSPVCGDEQPFSPSPMPLQASRKPTHG